MRKRRRSHRRRKNHTVRNIVIGCFVMTLLFATGYSAFQTVININVKGNIKEKSRTMRSWSNYVLSGAIWASNTPDFHNDEYREKIVSIEFVDSTNIPSNAIKNWDVSADGKGGVMAYITLNEEDSSKYNLYIGAKEGVIGNENSSWLFLNFNSLKSVDFNNNLDTSKTKTIKSMFYNCHNIEELDLSSFDTSNVTDMDSMFDDTDGSGTSKLKKIIFGNKWNTSKVTRMGNMFCDCHSLESIDISMFDTRSVYYMYGMFARCYNLTTIYVSEKFVTTNVGNSASMFSGDARLVGGNGTTCDSNHIDKEYARIDTPNTPGYFTLKQLNS